MKHEEIIKNLSDEELDQTIKDHKRMVEHNKEMLWILYGEEAKRRLEVTRKIKASIGSM